MGEPLKTFFSPDLVRRLAAEIVRVHQAFPARRFVTQACTGLEALELLDRGKHIATALAAHLPAAYPEAVDILIRSLGPHRDLPELDRGRFHGTAQPRHARAAECGEARVA